MEFFGFLASLVAFVAIVAIFLSDSKRAKAIVDMVRELIRLFRGW